tara:strand:- start:4323 stop:4817 length:495 start_codon:yes stop_codon:yes gene_type:complete
MSTSHPKSDQSPKISAVDLFSGAGGLAFGLRKAGIKVEAGIDIDPDAEFAFRTNNPGSEYLCLDLGKKTYRSIEKLFQPGKIRLLAGCAPCQPFSKYTNGKEKHRGWNLLDHFGRIANQIRPELVTMENVPGFEPIVKMQEELSINRPSSPRNVLQRIKERRSR